MSTTTTIGCGPRLRALLFAGCSGLVLAMAGAAQAQTSITATSTYTYGADSGSMTQSTPTYTSPDIDPSFDDGNGNSIFGHVYGDPTGVSFFGTRSSGQGTFGITGTLDYQTTYTNTTGGVVDPTLGFVIDAGELFVNLQSSGAMESAGLTAVITESIDGGTPIDLFNYASSMTATDPTADPTFTESGAVFNPSGPDYAEGYADYTWSPYDGSVSLGDLNAGDSVLIDYNLVSTASGTGSCTHVVTAELSSTDSSSSGCDSALARIGDPATITGDAPVSLVPEPASAALLGAGLAALAGTRKRRRAA